MDAATLQPIERIPARLCSPGGQAYRLAATLEDPNAAAAPAVVEAARKGEISINAAFKTVAPKAEPKPAPVAAPTVEPAPIQPTEPPGPPPLDVGTGTTKPKGSRYSQRHGVTKMPSDGATRFYRVTFLEEPPQNSRRGEMRGTIAVPLDIRQRKGRRMRKGRKATRPTAARPDRRWRRSRREQRPRPTVGSPSRRDRGEQQTRRPWPRRFRDLFSERFAWNHSSRGNAGTQREKFSGASASPLKGSS